MHYLAQARYQKLCSGQQCPKRKYQEASFVAVIALHQSVLLLQRLVGSSKVRAQWEQMLFLYRNTSVGQKRKEQNIV